MKDIAAVNLTGQHSWGQLGFSIIPLLKRIDQNILQPSNWYYLCYRPKGPVAIVVVIWVNKRRSSY